MLTSGKYVQLYAKNAKRTETEETIDFFVKFLSLVTFQSGEGSGLLGSPLATPMGQVSEEPLGINLQFLSFALRCRLS